jgi:hypoxanthine phosphoribosyltransferase
MATARNQLKVLLRRGAIERRVGQMGTEIARDFKGHHVHLIGVLKGATIFLADLIRRMNLDLSVDFIGVASYGTGQQSSGEVRLTKDLDTSIEDCNVILVEDILDTGVTINYLRRVLLQRRPRVLRVATLLAKPARAGRKVNVHYVGFRIPDQFVVGYGLDYAERYRNLPDVCVLGPPAEPMQSPGSTRNPKRKNRRV